MMEQTRFRSRLLSFGMALFSLAIVACLLNAAFFPYARGLHSMTLFGSSAVFVVYTLMLAGLSRLLKRIRTELLERCAAWLVPVFLLASLILMLLCGFWLAHEPFCDNAYVLHGADIVSRYGNFPRGLDDYTYYYLLHFPNQWGFTMLLSLLPFERLTASIGSSGILYLLSVIESLLYAFSFFALLRTVKQRFGVRAQLQLTFCLASFFPHYAASAVLYTDTFSMPFVLLALCCMLQIDGNTPRKKAALLSFGCGLALLIGGLIKMTCLILLIATAIVWLLTLPPKRAAVCLAVPLVIVTAGIKAFNFSVAHRVFDPDEAAYNQVPLLHWVMMSLPTGDNYYGSSIEDDYSYTFGLMGDGASKAEIMQSIRDRLGERLSAFRSFKNIYSGLLRKSANYMGDGTFGMTEMLDDAPLRPNILSEFVLYDGAYYSFYVDLCGGIWFAHLAAAALACLKDAEKRRFDLAIPAIAFLGLMIFEMLWEARSRYMFNFAPLILVVSACGLTRRAEQ